MNIIPANLAKVIRDALGKQPNQVWTSANFSCLPLAEMIAWIDFPALTRGGVQDEVAERGGL